jgi:ABC-2 type transport system permease protein
MRMLEDILTIVRKEFKEILQGSARSRSSGWLRTLVPIALAGVALPARSAGYLTSVSPVLGLAWILPMVSIALTVDAFAGERERRTLETLLASRLSDEAILLGKLFASVLYAWGLMVASLILAVITVNLTHPNGTFQMFPVAYGVALVGLGLLMAMIVCSAGVLVSLRASTVRQASQTLAFGMMATYFAAIFGFQALSRPHRLMIVEIMTGGQRMRAGMFVLALLVMVSLTLLAFAKARFKRARLILD